MTILIGYRVRRWLKLEPLMNCRLSNFDDLVTVVHVLDFTYCSYLFHMTVSLETYRAVPRFLLGAMLLILAVIAIL